MSVIPVEDFAWMFCGTYTIIIGYSTLLDVGKRERIDLRMAYFVRLALLALFGFWFVWVSGADGLFIWHNHWAYFSLGSLFFASSAKSVG
jgi:hypothetical protein